MSDGLGALILGAVGGGIVTFGLHAFEKVWIEGRLGESVDARRKLLKYAKPFWLACNDLEWRFAHILQKIRSKDNLEPLRDSPAKAVGLDWYVKEGYYTTSTAYLLANVAAWIRLFQRDVVFLRFRRSSATAQFFRLVESLKATLSTDSILWFHYFNGIGDYLIQGEVPMSIAAFSLKLATEESFRAYYSQLFAFLQSLTGANQEQFIERVIENLGAIKRCLEENGAVPEISAP